MVDSLFQGFGSGIGGTHNAVLSSTEYLSTAGVGLVPGFSVVGCWLAGGPHGSATGLLSTGWLASLPVCLPAWLR
jgi:hypothetical protein